MKTITSILALFIICSTLNAQFSKKIKGNGDIVTKTRTVSDFDKIGVAGSFDVKLIKGKAGTITIKADENLMEYIVTEVKDGNLKIKSKKGYQLRSSKSIQVTVTFDDLEAVSLAGSGDISSSDEIESTDLKLSLAGSGDIDLIVVAKNLTSKIAGSGNINLKGSAIQFTCSIAGSGDINGYGLKATSAIVKIAGSGDVKVNATLEINASIAGSGNVYYTGNPTEKVKSAGSGSLKKKN